MKIQLITIRIAGIICLIFTISHSFFYQEFQWKTSLDGISVFNRSIMLTYHWIIILMCGFMTVVTLFQTKKLISSNLKTSILIMFCLFMLIRICTEFLYFGLSKLSLTVLPLCIVPLVLFGIPLVAEFRKIH